MVVAGRRKRATRPLCFRYLLNVGTPRHPFRTTASYSSLREVSLLLLL
jgi:hypothetical protein